MKAVLLDTHAWAWSLTGDARLSEGATRAMARAHRVLVSPISFFEIGQKVRLGKWPEMESRVERLAAILEEQGGFIAALEPAICLQAGILPWEHRDPLDRLLAATARHYNLPLISADHVFDKVIPRLW